ncbi:MAG: hypothetical protein ABIY55_23320 [Kofleriaceae bacterium]
MAIAPCEACRKPMSSVAMVCPHCNARRAGATPGIGGKQLSPQEIRALVLTNAMLMPAPTQSLLPALIFPHPSTTGAARTAEIVLTIISLPLVAAGVLSLALSRAATRKRHDGKSGELAPVMSMLGLGGLGLTSLLSIAGAGLAANLAITAVSISALIGRAVIRARAARERRDDLERFADPG